MVEHAVPILPSRDLRESLGFYQRLGFVNLGAEPEEWDYLILGRGSIMLHFVATPDVDPLSTASSCFLYVDDVDAVHDAWRGAGLGGGPHGPRLVPPMDTDYGMRELAVVDPSGNLLRVGSPSPSTASASTSS
jgi:catechol 2,3-dioxygenase-like lactoylglutathione lyase family enzyme